MAGSSEPRDINDAVARFEHRWTRERDDWILVGDDEDRLIPFHRRTSSVLPIDEDDELANAVTTRMREAGVEVVISDTR